MVKTQCSHLGLFPSAGATQTWKPTSPWQANLRPSKALNGTGSRRLGLPQICGEIQIQFCAVLLSATHETWDVTFINGIRALTAPAATSKREQPILGLRALRVRGGRDRCRKRGSVSFRLGSQQNKVRFDVGSGGEAKGENLVSADDPKTKAAVWPTVLWNVKKIYIYINK